LVLNSGLAFGQTASAVTATVKTHKASYNSGEQLKIFGSVLGGSAGKPVAIILSNPLGHVIKVGQANLAADKTYSVLLVAGGNLWQPDGKYSILVEFGSKDK